MEDAAASGAMTVEFPNGNRAQLIVARRRRNAKGLLEAIGIVDSKPVIVVVGGADSLTRQVARPLQSLLERGVVPAAVASGAIVIDGGTDSGVMAALGDAVGA